MFVLALDSLSQYKIEVITDRDVNVIVSGKGGPFTLDTSFKDAKKVSLFTSAEGSATQPYVVWGMKLRRLEVGDPKRPRRLPLNALDIYTLGAGGTGELGPLAPADFAYDEDDMIQASGGGDLHPLVAKPSNQECCLCFLAV